MLVRNKQSAAFQSVGNVPPTDIRRQMTMFMVATVYNRHQRCLTFGCTCPESKPQTRQPQIDNRRARDREQLRLGEKTVSGQQQTDLHYSQARAGGR